MAASQLWLAGRLRRPLRLPASAAAVFQAPPSQLRTSASSLAPSASPSASAAPALRWSPLPALRWTTSAEARRGFSSKKSKKKKAPGGGSPSSPGTSRKELDAVEDSLGARGRALAPDPVDEAEEYTSPAARTKNWVELRRARRRTRTQNLVGDGEEQGEQEQEDGDAQAAAVEQEPPQPAAVEQEAPQPAAVEQEPPQPAAVEQEPPQPAVQTQLPRGRKARRQLKQQLKQQVKRQQQQQENEESSGGSNFMKMILEMDDTLAAQPREPEPAQQPAAAPAAPKERPVVSDDIMAMLREAGFGDLDPYDPAEPTMTSDQRQELLRQQQSQIARQRSRKASSSGATQSSASRVMPWQAPVDFVRPDHRPVSPLVRVVKSRSPADSLYQYEDEAEEDDDDEDGGAADMAGENLDAARDRVGAWMQRSSRSWDNWVSSVPPPPEDVIEKRRQLMAYVHQLANSLDSTKFRMLMRRLQRFKSLRLVTPNATRKFVSYVVDRVFDGHRDSIVSLRLVQHMMDMDLEELFTQRRLSLVALPYVAGFVLKSGVGRGSQPTLTADQVQGLNNFQMHKLQAGVAGSGSGDAYLNDVMSSGGGLGAPFAVVSPVDALPEDEQESLDGLDGFSGVIDCANGQKIAYETDPRAPGLQRYLFDAAGGAQFKVYVNNLHPEITLQEMIDQFGRCGEVRGVEIFRERLRGPRHIRDIRSFVEPDFGQHAALSVHQEDMESGVYGFVYFKDNVGVRNSLHMASQLFGIYIKGRPCRTEPPADKRTLYLGSLPNHLTSETLAKDWVESQLADSLPRGSVVSITNQATLRNGWCFVEFDAHASAWLAHRVLSQLQQGDRQVLRAGWHTHRLPNKFDVHQNTWLDQLSYLLDSPGKADPGSNPLTSAAAMAAQESGTVAAGGGGSDRGSQEGHTDYTQMLKSRTAARSQANQEAERVAARKARQHTEHPLLQYQRLARTEEFLQHNELTPEHLAAHQHKMEAEKAAKALAEHAKVVEQAEPDREDESRNAAASMQ